MNGLSFDQAPPWSLPLRFFLTAPVFLLAAGGLISLVPSALVSRWAPETLALTHLVTLGFLGSAMLGALLQLLPVVAGSPVPRVRAVAVLSHAALAAGTAALAGAFLTGEPSIYWIALALLGSGLPVFLIGAGFALAHAATGATTLGIRAAMVGLTVTLLLGLSLGLARSGIAVPSAWVRLVDAHLSFGLLGWMLMLVAAVAWQVVPMFQLTPRYPVWLQRGLPTLLFASLAVRALAPAWPWLTVAADVGIFASVLMLAAATLDLQRRRRRRVADVTLRFWRLGMASLLGCAAMWATAGIVPTWAESDAYPLLMGVLFLGGFGCSVVSGMLYKIVPFLAWFHLQTQLGAPAGSIPTMKAMIPERFVRWHFRVHVLACAMLAATPLSPQLLSRPAGIALALSALLLGGNLLVALRRFLRHGGRL